MIELADEDIKNQYTLLSILDSKSAGLLTFNTIFLTSISVWLGYVPLNYLHLALDVVFLALLISCALLLAVIRLRWSRLGESLSALNEIRESRTKRYRDAWTISVGCVCAVIIISAVHTVGTALTASKTCRQTCAWLYSQDVFGNLDARTTEK